MDTSEPSLPDPERIGPYHVLERIGEGGMGTVYAAMQEQPVRRKVALKIIKRILNRPAQVPSSRAFFENDGSSSVNSIHVSLGRYSSQYNAESSFSALRRS